MTTFEQALNWYNTEFKQTGLYLDMEATIESSPWHREANVGEHTNMVVHEYVRMCTEANDFGRAATLGLFSCVFHDTGKPAAKVVKFKEDRGHYFAFHGHETISSRLFETYACEHPSMFTGDEIYMICWMIEHHMPWEMGNAEKRRWLAQTANHIGIDVYTRALLADQFGRIADDADAKNARALDWITKFCDLAANTQANEYESSAPVLFVLIGASGSGKSTFIKNMTAGLTDPLVPFSLDTLRHQFYDKPYTKEGYREAFDCSVEDKTFASRADSMFISLIRQRHNIVVDNVNAGAKRRGKYVNEARRVGYKVVGVTFPVSLQTILDRQHTRSDKYVPDEAVKRQYASIQQPSYGEFDSVIVSTNNLVFA